jgi:transcriptional regulator with XRE-family HTH domain
MTTFDLMNIGENIKRIREQKGMLQKEVATAVSVHPSNYSKIEKGERLPSIDVADKLAKLFDMTVDQIIHLSKDLPQEITIEDKTTTEQLKLLQQLDEEDRKALFRIIDTMVTKKKFKDFLKENVEK